MNTTSALIGFGANQGDPVKCLQQAAELLSATAASFQCSKAWKSTAIENRTDCNESSAAEYVNAVLRFETTHSLDDFWTEVQQVELALGRDRRTARKWDSRPIDLDFLLFGKQQRRAPRLRLPHPWLGLRRFVLQPAAEIAPELVDPQTGRSLASLLTLLDTCPDLLIAVPKASQSAIAIDMNAAAALRNWGVVSTSTGFCVELRGEPGLPAHVDLRLVNAVEAANHWAGRVRGMLIDEALLIGSDGVGWSEFLDNSDVPHLLLPSRDQADAAANYLVNMTFAAIESGRQLLQMVA